jgi:hypothetical protein
MKAFDRGVNKLQLTWQSVNYAFRDGTARLWSCGEASCLATLVELGTTINSCCLGVANNKMQLPAPEEPPSMWLVLLHSNCACNIWSVMWRKVKGKGKVVPVLN